MMPIREQTEFAGKHFEATWQTGQTLPPHSQVTQVSAICFTSDNQVVLVSTDGKKWNIPGGHPERGETLEEALRREVWEEACCEISHLSLLGWQHVRDLQDESIHFQMRYWCQVVVKAFNAKHEIAHRQFTDPDEFLNQLHYGQSTIIKKAFRLALKENERHQR